MHTPGTAIRPVRTVASALAVGVLALSLGACGAKNSNDPDGGVVGGDAGESYAAQFADCVPGEGSADVSTIDVDDDRDITLAAFNGWDESFASAHLLKHVLEDDGYAVDIRALDAGPGYTGLAKGDIDVILDAWLPVTHEDYLEQYRDSIEPQGCWYDNAKLTIAVTEDSPARSIADLKDLGDEYGARIVGIEPGAGLTGQTRKAMAVYGLDDWTLQVSSTPAMLAELKKAADAGTDIAVTLWRPHWAYDAFPVRDLADPEGAMGEAEKLLNFSRAGFAADNPYVTQLLHNLVIDDRHLSSLENMMFSAEHYNGKNLDAAVAAWARDNPDFIAAWKAGALGN